MKRILFFALSLFLYHSATAQYYPVDTLQLNNAYRKIINGNNSLENQLDFLKAFPSTWLEYTLTYLYSSEKGFDRTMSQLSTEHCNVFGDSLYLVNDTIYCNKYINLVIGMQDMGESTIILQESLHGTMSRYGDTMMYLISKLRKGHQLQFWMFYWSSTAETAWRDEFAHLYNKYKDIYPKETEKMKIGFDNFEDGIDYPNLLPHIVIQHK